MPLCDYLEHNRIGRKVWPTPAKVLEDTRSFFIGGELTVDIAADVCTGDWVGAPGGVMGLTADVYTAGAGGGRWAGGLYTSAAAAA